ncbi:MAG: Lrp/AsnC ligand binding domain-containing protein [Gammaproteobacteria bacterium]
MRTIFVLIKTALGKTYDVANSLSDEAQKFIPEIYSISGKYDLIAKYHLPSDIDVGHFINEELHRVPHIVDTYTMVAFRPFTKDTQPGLE